MSYIRLIETIPEINIPRFYMRYGVICFKAAENETLVSGLTTKSPALIIIKTALYDAIIAEMIGDTTKNEVCHRIIKEIRLIFKQNVRDVEKQTNILGDPTLPGKFAMDIIGPRTPIDIPDIFAENTAVIGELFIRVKAMPMVRLYMMVCTHYGSDDVIISVIERQFMYASGNLDGFASGDKYHLKAYGIFPNGSHTEPTSTFEIRIN